MSSKLDDLAEKIDATRITYPERGAGVTIEGQPFICNFEEEHDPERLANSLCAPDNQYNLWGIPMQLAEDYWKISGVLFPLKENERTTSKITLEISPTWIRVYVKEGCSEHRAATFIEQVGAEHDLTVKFSSDIDDAI